MSPLSERAGRPLRLSLFTVPEVSIGSAPLTPQNSQVDPRRVQYLEGMVTYLGQRFRDLQRSHSRSEALARLESERRQLPYAELVRINGNGGAPVSEVAGARDRIAFDHERLKISFPDGRHRGDHIPAIPAGRDSPAVSRIVSRLAQGVSEGELSRLLEDGDVDVSAAIQGLRDLQLIEETDASAPLVPERLSRGGDDRLAWLGHACMLFQTGRSSVCVDPFLRPHINWSEQEVEACFSDSFGESLLFEPYGPRLPQLSPAELPRLDAVFITHQDTDHCNLGVLMMLPEELPIVVPDFRADRPWEVDLATLIQTVLGPQRKVVRLKHGETMTIGDIRATAFPFRGEMPSSLATSWNCYLFETDHVAVACTADAAITDDVVDFLIERLGRGRKPFVLCARLVHSGMETLGYRDESDSLLNFTRLWAWHVPAWDLFQPAEQLGISERRLRRLSRSTNLRYYLPYAMGTAPWYRIGDVNDPLHVPLANLSVDDLRAVREILAGIPDGPALFPGKFAQPFRFETVARRRPHDPDRARAARAG